MFRSLGNWTLKFVWNLDFDFWNFFERIMFPDQFTFNLFEQDGWVHAKILIQCEKKKEKLFVAKVVDVLKKYFTEITYCQFKNSKIKQDSKQF